MYSGGCSPRPISISVPTMARTMLRRKRLAEIWKTSWSRFTHCHSACTTRQLLVYTCVLDLLKHEKSSYCCKIAAASFIADTSGASRSNQDRLYRKGSLRRCAWYSYD